MNVRYRHPVTVMVMAACAASSAMGQPSREPTVDLKREAGQPRAGQILPGPARPPATVPTPPASGKPAQAEAQMRESTGAASGSPAGAQADAATSAPHVFADRTAAQQLAALRASMRDEGVEVSVVGGSGDGPAQWRVAGPGEGEGAWSDIALSAAARGVVEIRTGLFRTVTFEVAGGMKVTVMRASRVVIKQVRVGEDKPDAPAPRRLVVQMQRGRVSVDPGAKTPEGAPRLITVTTPDWMAVTGEPLEVSRDPAGPTTTRYLPAR